MGLKPVIDANVAVLFARADSVYKTPLVDLLRRVPADARLLIIEDNPYSTLYIPVGRLCHEAAALLALEATAQGRAV